MTLENKILKNKNAIDNLKILGLIWGFLKYYHPIVATGKYNWDKELFRLIPIVINANSKNIRDKILAKWIKELGDFKIGNRKLDQQAKDIKLEPYLDWIENSSFTKELKDILLKVKKAERTGKNHYVMLYRNAGNPTFKDEKPYPTKKYPDTNKRILSLFRYWNIIQFFFPYKYLIEGDWKNVLEEFIPKFVKVGNKNAYLLVILELISRINDTHAGIFGDNYWLEGIKGSNFAPIDLSYIEDKVVITGFYNDKYKNSFVRLVSET